MKKKTWVGEISLISWALSVFSIQVPSNGEVGRKAVCAKGCNAATTAQSSSRCLAAFITILFWYLKDKSIL